VLRFTMFYLQHFRYSLHEKCYFSLPVRYGVDSNVQGQAGPQCVFRVLKHSSLTLVEEAGWSNYAVWGKRHLVDDRMIY